jgi:hypothetical protein
LVPGCALARRWCSRTKRRLAHGRRLQDRLATGTPELTA